MEPQYSVQFKCGRDGAEWRGYLRRVGPKYGFFRFSRSGEDVSIPLQDRKAEIMRQLSELTAAPLPLPPPPQAEIVEVDAKKELTSDDITSYGFECPSCRNNEPLLCPECRQYSCRGSRDSHDRYLCQWCGETLVTRPLTPEEIRQPHPPSPIAGQQKTLQVRVRELKAGDTT